MRIFTVTPLVSFFFISASIPRKLKQLFWIFSALIIAFFNELVWHSIWLLIMKKPEQTGLFLENGLALGRKLIRHFQFNALIRFDSNPFVCYVLFMIYAFLFGRLARLLVNLIWEDLDEKEELEIRAELERQREEWQRLLIQIEGIRGQRIVQKMRVICYKK